MLAVGKKGEKNGERKSAASGLVLVSSASSGLGGEPDFPLERLCCCRGWGLMWVWQEGGGGRDRPGAQRVGGLEPGGPTGAREAGSSHPPSRPPQSRFLKLAPAFHILCPSSPFSSVLSKFLKEKRLKKHTTRKVQKGNTMPKLVSSKCVCARAEEQLVARAPHMSVQGAWALVACSSRSLSPAERATAWRLSCAHPGWWSSMLCRTAIKSSSLRSQPLPYLVFMRLP